MPSYAAPLADMRFAIHRLVRLDEIGTLPGFDEATPDLVDAVLEEAARFAAEVLAPLDRTGDRQGCAFENGRVRTPDGFPAAYRKFVQAGWNGLALDRDHGGQGLPRLVASAVAEIWHGANMSFGLCPLLTQAAADVLARHGTPDLKARYLANLVSGAWTGTMNLTEPQAGSDLARIRTRAVRDGDIFRISGQKIFISYGDHDLAPNVVHMVLARSPDGPPGIRGLSLFLVPKVLVDAGGGLGPANEVRCVSIEHKLGIRASPTCVMSYGGERGAVGFLVGEENGGIQNMFAMMNNARLAVGLEGVGVAERALQEARAYARERVQGYRLGDLAREPVAIASHPDVRRMLLTMKAATEAARALAYRVAADVDLAIRHPDPLVRSAKQAGVDLLTPVVKGWCTEIGVEAGDAAIQVHGGTGYVEETGVAQRLRDARVATIYEGTNGIQAVDLVFRKVARDRGEAARAFLARVRTAADDLAGARSPQAGAVGSRLTSALDALGRAVEWVVDRHAQEPDLVAAGAFHLLKLFGLVAGGWQMAEAAAAAERELVAGAADRSFLEAKLLTARFFADQFLPEAPALAERIVGGSAAVVAVGPEDV